MNEDKMRAVPCKHGQTPRTCGWCEDEARLRADAAASIPARDYKPEPDLWRLTTPIGLSYYGSTPMECLRNEQHDRIPASVALARIWAAVDELESEVERDAARYRYLRNRIPKDVLNVSGPAAGCWIDCEDGAVEPYPLTLLTGTDADAAIDAAMKQGASNE